MTVSEFDPTGKKPDRTYKKMEILYYLDHYRQKANRLIAQLTPIRMNDRWIDEYKNYSVLEILLYNMRHIQHHSTELNLILRQTIDNAPKWVGQAQKILHNK